MFRGVQTKLGRHAVISESRASRSRGARQLVRNFRMPAAKPCHVVAAVGGMLVCRPVACVASRRWANPLESDGSTERESVGLGALVRLTIDSLVRFAASAAVSFAERRHDRRQHDNEQVSTLHLA